MSLLALKTSMGGAPTLAEHSRDLGGKSGGGSEFTAIMSALAGEGPQSTARAAATKGAASGQDHGSPSENTAKSQESSSMDEGLAGLVDSALAGETLQPNARAVATTGAAGAQGRAPASESTPQSQGSSSIDAGLARLVDGALAREGLQPNARAAATKAAASVQDPASPSQNTPQSQGSSSIDAGLAGLVYGALAASVGATPGQIVSPDAGGTGAPQQSAAGSASGVANGSPTVGGPLWRALEGRGASVGSDQSSGSPDAAPLAGVVDALQTVQMAANGDSSLGLSGIRSRTFLAVDNAAQSEARSPIWRSQARSAAQATAAVDSAAPASTGNGAPPEKRSASGHNGPQTVPAPDPSAEPAPAAIGPSASLGAVNLGINPGATSASPVALGQLAERLATEASGLTSRAPTSDSAPATGVGSAQAVKELQIDLDPADLGAVSVKMRLVQGKLSVVMEVATPSTLKAIENERGAITDRLGTAAQPLEALIIKASATSQTNAESDNARDRKPGSQENGQNDSNQDAQGNGQQSSRREQAAGQRNPQAMARQPAPRGGFGDLLV
jgi:hypothetical protein